MKKFIVTYGPAAMNCFFIVLTARHLDDHEYGSAFLTGSCVFAITLWAACDDVVKAIKELKKP